MSIYGTRAGVFTAKKLKIQDKVPVNFSIQDTVATSTTAIANGFDLATNGTASITPTSFSVQPPYPMVISVQAVDAGTAGNTDTLTFKGYDAKGNYIEEAVTVSSTAATINYSNNAFARIDSVLPNAVSASDDVNIGYINRIGLPYPIASSNDILIYNYAGSTATTAPYGTVDSTYDKIYHEGIAASQTVDIMYTSRFQE